MLDSKDPKTPREFHMVKLHNRAKDLINLLLKTKKSVSLGITGSGDPFASPLYWTYLKELANNPIPDNLYINLQTNGLLMTKENLEKIKPLWKHISHVSVSIDAVKKETYAVVRKNGILDKLKRNLEVFDDMVLDGKFPIMEKWQTNFIVQRDNFRETVEYLEWQLTFKSKPVIWTHLINQWDHISNSEFSKIAVHLPEHSFYKELKQILINPIFKNPQIKLGNLNSLL
jgi:MoaA/NifB/PqqE/SkfB family radical SAM enzyme